MEPFKNFFNVKIIEEMAGFLQREYAEFDADGFVAFCIEDIETRELKQRSNRIVEGLELFLTDDFSGAAKILVASLDTRMDLEIDSNGQTDELNGIRGWPIMPMADFVALRGQGDVELAMETLRQLTSRWSAEFALRPFLKKHPLVTLKILQSWIGDENYHVRRLVSEGTRPLLPWGMRLHQFVDDPAPVLKLLECLKDDKSEYVRRSVANNLNDISKHHPQLVVEIANSWMKNGSADRQRLVRHALRGLIKQGHKGAFAALGYRPAEVGAVEFVILTPKVVLGEALEFRLNIHSRSKRVQPLVIDFVVHHRLANGKTSPKGFKWKKVNLGVGQKLEISKRHPMKPITTRKYYAGGHRVEINANGKTICGDDFELSV